jgi:2'-5' RNA ligase
MMRLFPVVLICFSLISCASHPPAGSIEEITYSPKEIASSPARDLSHERPETKSYLSIDLPHPAFEKIRREVEQNQKVTLKNRGESHITVITPPEYKKIQQKVTMKEIYQLAKNIKLMESPYRPLCIGRGQIKDSPDEGVTFYVVVDSERLFELRQNVLSLYLSRGGTPGDFSPENFYPHITLGFTKRDLHFEDGVIKDASTCIYSLRPEEVRD